MPYEFTVEDYNKFTQDIIESGGDQAVMSTLLADMQATFLEAVASNATLSQDNEIVKTENERLKNANMDLMYRLGQKAIEENQPEKTESVERGKNVDAYLDKIFEEEK